VLTLLRVNNIEVVYSSVILTLRGVSLEVPDRQIVAILGANGAGKTTTLKAISGLLHTELGEIIQGNIQLDGERIDGLSPQEISRKGIVQVMEGRRLYEHLTTEENLRLGGYLRRKSEIEKRLDLVYGYFARLRDLKDKISGYLSGGEQQMLVIGRGLMAAPRVMLIDEASLGLAPLLINNVFKVIQSINAEEKIAILLVEQNALAALRIAGYAYVMENGRVVLHGVSEKLKENEDIREFYLGLSQVGKKSYKEIKHYKRRKRWLG
jgi:branched-chain amino acid transport system ATP-binding protein